MTVDFFQKKTSWYTTFIFSLLAVAFLFSSFQGGTWRLFQPVVFTVGSRSVRLDEMRRLLQQKEAMNRLLGKSLRRSVLASMVMEDCVLGQEMDDMKLEISQQSAEEALHQHRVFLDDHGNFDDKKLQAFLRETHITLSQLLDEEKKLIGQRYLEKAMMAQISIPTGLVQLVMKGIFQERQGLYHMFADTDAKDVGTPSEAQLAKMYEEQETLPEETRITRSLPMRTYKVLRLSPTLFMQDMKVSEQEIKEYHALKMDDRPLAEVRGAIVQKLKVQKSHQRMEKLLAKIEDALGGGKSLVMIAAEEKLPLYSLTTDVMGRGMDLSLMPELTFPELGSQDFQLRQSLMARIFDLEEKQEPELISLPEGEHCFVQVEKVVPEKKLSLQEAMPRLKVEWQKQQRYHLLKMRAQSFQRKPDPSKMTLSPMVTMNSPLNGIPLVVKEALFALPLKGSAMVQDDKGLYVVQLTKMMDPKIEKSKMISMREREDIGYIVVKELRSICWRCYIQSLSRKYPLSINDAYMDFLMGKE